MGAKLEKPNEEELERLYQKYGEPDIKEDEVKLSSLEYTEDYPDCKGEAVIEILKDGKVVGVKHAKGGKFVLPMGRVWEKEEFVEGAMREAREETGLNIDLKDLKEIRKVRFYFSNAELIRWHLLFEAEAVGGKLEPEDKEEIAESKLIDGEWYWNKGGYIIRETNER